MSIESYTVYKLSHYHHLKEVLPNYATILEERISQTSTGQEVITVKVQYNSDLDETFCTWSLLMRDPNILTDREAEQRAKDDDGYDWWAARLEELENDLADRTATGVWPTTFDKFVYSAGPGSPVIGWDLYVEEPEPIGFADYTAYNKFRKEYRMWRELDSRLPDINEWLLTQRQRLLPTADFGDRLSMMLKSLDDL